MICSICGYEIKDEPHSIDNGKNFVCDKCWNNPELFFPEKIEDDARLKLLSQIADEKRNKPASINIEAIRIQQKEIDMYMGKMKPKDILQIYEIDKFKEEELEGYQRELYEERTSELVEYLAKCPLAIMPALLVSLREAEFNSQHGDFGVLSIPRKKGAIWIIDGQHRIGGFSKVRNRFVYSKDVNPSLFSNLMNYEFPVVFINSKEAAQRISTTISSRDDFSSEDVERTIFFIVNKTQKGINSSLKDALLYRIKKSGIQGLPIIRKESWRIRAAHIAIKLNKDANSPLTDKINISGRRGTGKPIRLNSFVSSLRELFHDDAFSKMSNEDEMKFVRTYWTVLEDLLPETFDSESYRNNMLLKALGIYSLNWLAKDVLHICIKQNYDLGDSETLKKLLRPLKSFDWNTQTSPLSSLGGMKGVDKAHDILLATIDYKSLVQDDEQISLNEY